LYKQSSILPTCTSLRGGRSPRAFLTLPPEAQPAAGSARVRRDRLDARQSII